MQKITSTVLCLIASAMAPVLSSSISSAELINVDQLNQKLEGHATWTAKDSWVNHVSKSDIHRMLGVKNVKDGMIQVRKPEFSAMMAQYPAVLDWRNKDGKNYVSPILNQGNCGSCVAFSSIATLETQLNISDLFPGLNIRLSPQNLFSCGGGGCEVGWQPDSAASYLQDSGVVDEACMPYTAGSTGQDVSCNALCSDASSRTFRLANYSTPTSGGLDVDAVKAALQHGPLVTTLSVYADFMAYSSGVYKHHTGEVLGGHAISIVGYDDTKNAFIIRNSWGEDWGENGFAYVDYDDVSGVGSDTWSYETPATTGVVAVAAPRDYDFVSGVANLQGSTNYTTADSLKFVVYNSANKAVLTQTYKGTRGVIPFDSAKVADGRYEVEATAVSADGREIDHSVRSFFYVVNSKPTLAISFTGHNVNLTRPVSARIEFDVTATSSPVPMSSVEFHYRPVGGTETTRTINQVVPHMVVGWRTNLVPNGKYELWFVGKISPANGVTSTVESNHVTVQTKN